MEKRLSVNSQLYAIRQKLAQEGVKHKGRSVPFGVTNEVLPVSEATKEKLRTAGNTIGNFLAAVKTHAMAVEREWTANYEFHGIKQK